MSTVRVRFAPSPTGYLHVGGLRTALYNYLFAKKNSGTFILRIEDSDRKRFVEGAAEQLIAILDRMDMHYDEGVFLKNQDERIKSQGIKISDSKKYSGLVEAGEYDPYIQSERLDIYQKYAEELIEKKYAYRCFCTSERLEQLRAEQVSNKQAPRYDKQCLALTTETVQEKLNANEPSVIRLNVSAKHPDIVFVDLVRGMVTFKTQDIDDQVLMKSDGFPTYHLANVVDDHLMKISHVIRAEEWLPSTPKHILLYEAFGWEIPLFAHLPLLLNPDKSKLSKRQGDVAVEDYLTKGYLKEALINFVALLGWNPGNASTQELFTLEELVAAFDLSLVHKGGAVFDQKKLDWMNGEYIKRFSVDELFQRITVGGFFDKPLITDAPESMRTEEYLKKVLAIEQERLTKLSEIGEQNTFFFTSDLAYDQKDLHWKDNDDVSTRTSLSNAKDVLAAIPDTDWTRERLEGILLEAAGDHAQSLGGIEAGRGRGDFLWPLRVALTGARKSPSPFDCAWVLGKDECLRRLNDAIQRLG